MKNSKELGKIPQPIKGYLISWIDQADYNDDIHIYGDSEGLKSLGEALIAIAELDQKKLKDSECPPNDSFHQHYNTGLNINKNTNLNQKNLIIGRVEEKESGKIRACFPLKA